MIKASWLRRLGGLLSLAFCAVFVQSALAAKEWAVYYSDKIPAHEFKDYKLLIFDSDYHPDLSSLQNRGITLLGYISLGEVNKQRVYYKSVEKDQIVYQENKNWPGSFFVDMRDPRWTKRVVEKLIPAILRQGFDGIFLDTLDNAGEMERTNPKKFKGMVKGAVNLVKTIRHHYPDMPIMMNRGYELLPDVAKDITAELGESIYTDYNFKEKTYGFVPKALYKQQVKILKDAKKVNPKLNIYTLDYWYPRDKRTIRKIYQAQRKNGFMPYVSTVELNKLVVEP